MFLQDPDLHVKNLKTSHEASPLVNHCIECGFCESACPSKDVTLTPRQRITSLREIPQAEGDPRQDSCSERKVRYSSVAESMTQAQTYSERPSGMVLLVCSGILLGCSGILYNTVFGDCPAPWAIMFTFTCNTTWIVKVLNQPGAPGASNLIIPPAFQKSGSVP